MPHFLKKAHLVAPFFYLLTQYAYATNPLEAHYQFSEFLYSPAMPVNNISNWDGELKANNFAHGHFRQTAGFQWDRWQFGVVKRRDFWATFSSDTSELYHQLQTGVEPLIGRVYQIELNSQDLQTKGFFVGYELMQHPNFSINVSGSYLTVSNYEFGTYKGQAQRIEIAPGENPNKQYKLDIPFEIHHQGSNCLVGSHICRPPADTGRASDTGVGYSLDIKSSFFGSWISGSLEITDLVNQMNWKGLMHTKGKLIPFTAINEFIPGQEAHTYNSFSIRLPTKAVLNTAIPLHNTVHFLSRYHYVEGLDEVPDYSEASLGLGFSGNNTKLSLLQGIQHDKKEFSLTYRCLSGGIGFDQWDLTSSRNISLSMAIKLTQQGCTQP